MQLPLKNLRALCIPICVLMLSTPAMAEEPRQYQLSEKQMRCLFEHQQKYLDLPRAVLLFTPAYCPAVTREEVARYQVQNSENEGPGADRLFFRKTDFLCLVEKIGVALERLDASVETSDADVSESFVLDCE